MVDLLYIVLILISLRSVEIHYCEENLMEDRL